MAIQEKNFASILGFSAGSVEGAFLDLRGDRVLLVTAAGASYSIPVTASELESLGDIIAAGDLSCNVVDCTSVTSSGDIVIDTAADSQAIVDLGSNRASADTVVGAVRAKWNGNQVARMFFFSGGDTTNKDEGYLRFDLFSAGIARTSILQIGTATTLDSTFNVNGYNADVTMMGTGGSTVAHFDASAASVGINKTGPTDTLDVNGGAKLDYANFNPVAAAGVPNGSVFLDAADNNIKCKGTAGTLTIIGPP